MGTFSSMNGNTSHWASLKLVHEADWDSFELSSWGELKIEVGMRLKWVYVTQRGCSNPVKVAPSNGNWLKITSVDKGSYPTVYHYEEVAD